MAELGVKMAERVKIGKMGENCRSAKPISPILINLTQSLAIFWALRRLRRRRRATRSLFARCLRHWPLSRPRYACLTREMVMAAQKNNDA
jgi:hypothetical protein